MDSRIKEMREKSDYEDFYVASRHEAETQYSNAEEFYNQVRAYLSKIAH